MLNSSRVRSTKRLVRAPTVLITGEKITAITKYNFIDTGTDTGPYVYIVFDHAILARWPLAMIIYRPKKSVTH